MNRLLLMLALALPGLAAADLTINLNGVPASTAPMGCRGTISATPTYALNSASPTVASVAIDLGANPDVFVSVTGAANIPGGPVVAALFAPTSTGTFQVGYKLNGAGNACVPRLNRYMKLVNMSQMSSTTYAAKALTVTASYMLATADIGTATVNGMASLSTTATDINTNVVDVNAAITGGFSNTNTNLEKITYTSAIAAGALTSTPKVIEAAHNSISNTTYAITNNVVTAIPLTYVAGANTGVADLYFGTNGNFRWAIDTAVPPYLTGTAGLFQAGSTTAIPMIDYNLAINPVLYVVGAAQNCDLWLCVMKKQ